MSATRSARLTLRYGIGLMAQQGVLFLLLPLYTAELSTKAFGAMSLLHLSGTVLNDILFGPIQGGLARFFYRPGYVERQREILGSVLPAAMLLLLIEMAVLCALAPLINGLLFEGDEYLNLVWLYVFAVPWYGAARLNLRVMQLRERAWTFAGLEIFQAVVSAGTIIALIFIFDWGVPAVPVGFGISWAAQYCISISMIAREAQWGWNFDIVRSLSAFGLGLLPGTMGGYAMMLGDRYVINSLAGIDQVGIFALGASLASVMSIIYQQPVTLSVDPLIKRAEADPPYQRQLIAQIALLSFAAGCGLALALALASREIVELVAQSPAYYGAWPVLGILVFALVVRVASNFTGMGLYFADRPWVRSAVVLFAAVLNIVLNILLVPVAGIIGAAFATLLSYLCWMTANLVIARKIFPVRFPLPAMGMLAATAGGFAYLGLNLPAFESIVIRGCLLACYAALAMLAIYATDREMFLQIWRTARELNVRKLVGAIAE